MRLFILSRASVSEMFSDFESNKTTSSLRAKQVVYDSNKRSIMNVDRVLSTHDDIFYV